jgi:hypothetical protein
MSVTVVILVASLVANFFLSLILYDTNKELNYKRKEDDRHWNMWLRAATKLKEIEKVLYGESK